MTAVTELPARSKLPSSAPSGTVFPYPPVTPTPVRPSNLKLQFSPDATIGAVGVIGAGVGESGATGDDPPPHPAIHTDRRADAASTRPEWRLIRVRLLSG